MASSELRFTFSQIYDYLRSSLYPDGFDKSDKRSLRRRADFFFVREAKLYSYSGQGNGKSEERLVVEDEDMRKRTKQNVHKQLLWYK